MYDKELKVALKAVEAAEEVVLRYLDEGVRAELKDDQTPVTAADREAEETIKRVIREQFPDHTFFGEEGEKADLRGHKGWTWIIDPIDGTRSYVRKNPLFAMLLALMHDGEFVVGVSNAPLMHERMWATRGGGCWLNGERVRVSEVDGLDEAYMSYGSLDSFGRLGLEGKLTQLTGRVAWERGIGDWWSYHLVAQGKTEIMLEARTALWDIAAFIVIVEEAGGRMTQMDGSDLNAEDDRMTALASNGRVHDDVVRAMQI